MPNQVELITNGGFVGLDACIGKVFTATPVHVLETNEVGGYDLPIAELLLAGAVSHELVGMTKLHFFKHEVRVLNNE